MNRWVLGILLFTSVGCGAFLNQTQGTTDPTPNPIATSGPNTDLLSNLLESTTSIESKKINLTFKDSIEVSTATNIGNFTINKELTIIAANLDSTGKILTLEVDKHMLPSKTTITASNLKTTTNKSLTKLQTSFTPATKVAFLSDTSGKGNFALWTGANGRTGRAAADQVCVTEALAAGYEGDFVAFVSDSQNNVKDLLGSEDGSWITTNPKHSVFAKNKQSLLEGKTLVPLNYTAFGTTNLDFSNGFGMATGSSFDGVKSSGTSAGKYCNDWSSDQAGFVLDDAGNSVSNGAFWTSRRSPFSCNTLTKLYCLQKGVGHSIVETLPQASRKTFVTSIKGKGDIRTWQADGGVTNLSGYSGIGAAHTVCQLRAKAANLPNHAKYKAWLSTTTASAISQVLDKTTPIYNTQGSLVAKDLQTFASGTVESGISFDEFGQVLAAGVSTFSGTAIGGGIMTTTANVTSVNHCANWQGQNDSSNATKHSASYGQPGWNNATWLFFFSNENNCAIDASLVCIEDM